ncbi:MAG TPA: hypothetical protein VH877_10235 [Polyangia bacterium]|nr:hypothetical protein [Polyangia bacterium]
MMDMLGRAVLPPPSSEALQRAAAPILAEFDASVQRAPVQAGQSPGWALVLPAVVAGGAVALWLTSKGPVMPERSYPLALGLAMVAILGATISRYVRYGAAALGGMLFVSLAASLLTATENSLQVGFACLSMELAVAAIPIGTTVILARARGIVGPPGYYMMAAAAGALAGQAVLEMRCPAGSLFHMLGFHTGGVLMAIGIAGLVARLPRLQASAASR